MIGGQDDGRRLQQSAPPQESVDLAQALVDAGQPVHGVLFGGRRYDTGDKQEYLRAVVRLACEREDLGPDFRAWLRDFTSSLPDG